MKQTAIRIAQVFYDALRQRFDAVVELFAPGMPEPMRIPVHLNAPQNMDHARLARALAREAQRDAIWRY